MVQEVQKKIIYIYVCRYIGIIAIHGFEFASFLMMKEKIDENHPWVTNDDTLAEGLDRKWLKKAEIIIFFKHENTQIFLVTLYKICT